EDGLEREQVLWTIVHEQDVHLVAKRQHATRGRLHRGDARARHAFLRTVAWALGSAPRKDASRSSGKTRAVGTALSAARGIVLTSAVSGACTTASPPPSAIRRRPRAPSSFAPVSTRPTA